MGRITFLCQLWVHRQKLCWGIWSRHKSRKLLMRAHCVPPQLKDIVTLFSFCLAPKCDNWCFYQLKSEWQCRYNRQSNVYLISVLTVFYFAHLFLCFSCLFFCASECFITVCLLCCPIFDKHLNHLSVSQSVIPFASPLSSPSHRAFSFLPYFYN